MPNQRSGLRTTVYLYGTVVQQQVDWCPIAIGRRRWRSAGEMLPGVGSSGLARYRWARSGDVELEPVESGVVNDREGSWCWAGGGGVRVTLDVIPMKRAMRRSQEQIGDLALLVMMLTLMVGVAQLNFLFRAVVGERVASTEAMTPHPSLSPVSSRRNSTARTLAPSRMSSVLGTSDRRSHFIFRLAPRGRLAEREAARLKRTHRSVPRL